MADLLNMLSPRPLHSVRRMVILMLLATLAACSPLQQLRHATERDSGTFSANLAAEYLAFAESEKELGRDTRSDYFARKGLQAAKGKPPAPEHPANWPLNAEQERALFAAHDRLNAVHTDFLSRVASLQVARAQLLYDCWVMQAADPSDNEDALPCQSEFDNEVTQLEQIISTLGPRPKVELPAHYTVLFPIGSSKLGRNAEFTIQEVLAITRLYPEHRIEVTGHTDRSGSTQRNQVVSEQRAQQVADALIAAGIDPERIHTAGMGEHEPVIPTLDGIRRERNRRAEILVLPLESEAGDAR